MKFKQALNEYVKVKIGDTILMGKFKNKEAEIEEFDTDDNNQPIIVTNKGKKPLYNFRIKKLMPKKEKK